jgi:hypothetical protein
MSMHKAIDLRSYDVNTYLLPDPPILSIEECRNALIHSLLISIKFKDGGIVNYLYDNDNDLLHFSGRIESPQSSFFAVNSLTIKTFLSILDVERHIETLELLKYKVVKTKKVIDYAKIITDLSGKGIVGIRPSNNVMAVDERKFYFLNDEDHFDYDVDCLGTKACQDITLKVTELWLTKFFKVYS